MSRVQTVVASLRDLVLSGRLAPGERIVELVYAPQLGVSRTPLRWALWLILLADLLIKLHYEERLLVQHFRGYRDYMAVSKRLVPYVY